MRRVAAIVGLVIGLMVAQTGQASAEAVDTQHFQVEVRRVHANFCGSGQTVESRFRAVGNDAFRGNEFVGLTLMLHYDFVNSRTKARVTYQQAFHHASRFGVEHVDGTKIVDVYTGLTPRIFSTETGLISLNAGSLTFVYLWRGGSDLVLLDQSTTGPHDVTSPPEFFPRVLTCALLVPALGMA